MTAECYRGHCRFHGIHVGYEGPFCEEPVCRYEEHLAAEDKERKAFGGVYQPGPVQLSPGATVITVSNAPISPAVDMQPRWTAEQMEQDERDRNKWDNWDDR